MASRIPLNDELAALISMEIGSFVAALLNGEFAVAGGDRRFRIVSGGARGQVCACARWVTLMVYFPAMALPAVVALNAVLLVVVVAEKDRL